MKICKHPVTLRGRGIASIGFCLLLLSACSISPPNDLGVDASGTLTKCPSSPNCVSSFAPASDKTHFIRPLHVTGAGWNALQAYLQDSPRFEIAEHKGHYVHALATTPILHFVDDVEFLYQPSKHLIQVRSASRIGYSDFGKNRSRIEHLRKVLSSRGVLVD